MSATASQRKHKVLVSCEKHNELVAETEASEAELLGYLEDFLHREVNLTVEGLDGNYSVHIEKRVVTNDGHEGSWDSRSGSSLANGTSFNCVVKRAGITDNGRAYLVVFVVSSTQVAETPLVNSWLLCENEYRIWLDQLFDISLIQPEEE